ncbi:MULTISPECIES: TetR/AcrR family transcriptional regulator [Actinoalloteichus]|uniref:Transcriptional regulator, TetR family n=2 Tax=Actinoalloteichus cyanogriseus TaxID=2893586 RepID=A0ABT1JMQ7_ACTCY|nr:TetR/AcrR family transcriptional regulator [Actinoalloteichus caeruleus]MCP2333815.1 transcriptional regulator, TetR family [Actinoalloteichus caeruleus DSM 43889]
MPRHVDREERRHHVADALLRIIEREGLEAVSVRTVSAEAGCSVGAVQRYFRSKDEMLRFALETAISRAASRMAEIRLGPGLMSFPDALRAAVVEYLPLDDGRLAESRIWAAFSARAVVDPAFRAVITALDRPARDQLARVFAYAESVGELPAGHDHEALACLVIALMDGLMWSLLLRPAPEERAVHLAAVDAAVRALTTKVGRPTTGGDETAH